MCAQPVQAIPRRYTRSTWALVQRCVGSNSFSSQWTPRTRFSEPLPRSTKRRRQGSGSARRGPGAAGCKYPVRLRSMHGRPRASRWNMPCLRCIQHEQATYLCAPPFRRRDMLSLLFPSRSGNLLFSSPCRHFSFSLFASFAQDENRSIAFLSAVSLQRPFPS